MYCYGLQGAGGGPHGQRSFCEEVPRNPGRAHVMTDGPRLPLPASSLLDGDENQGALLVDQMIIGHEDVAFFQDLELHLDADRAADVNGVTDLAVLGAHADGAQANDVVARRFHNVAPLARGGRTRPRTKVRADNFVRRAVAEHAPLCEQDRARTEPRDSRHIVRDEEYGASLLPDALHLVEALTLESCVADGEHLVNNQHLRVEMRGHGEGLTNVHPRRVAFDGRVEELPDFGE